ncbi:MAG TPA: hypothetical protein VNI58_03675 [Mariprofundaceae bacterium]|nr:hypothetical protein [Mariprofundaceae bacterium]
MAEQDKAEAIRGIRKTQENFAVGIGFVIALTLSVYFFTYAMLTDKGLHSLLWFQAISTLVMVYMLIRLKRISFFCARLLLGRRAKYREALAGMTIADLAEQ